MADVRQQLTELAKRVSDLKARSLSEDDTKAVLIEPALKALGWDMHDPDEVKRQQPVRAGGRVDYGLKLRGNPKLYAEAKSLGEQLDDDRFKTKTVNYANNDGVEWCVLTDGNIWRVYKSNALGDVNEKLLFEARLTDLLSDAASKTLERLQLLSQDSLLKGKLDEESESHCPMLMCPTSETSCVMFPRLDTGAQATQKCG